MSKERLALIALELSCFKKEDGLTILALACARDALALAAYDKTDCYHAALLAQIKEMINDIQG